MRSLEFVKMHGLGNDFIMLDADNIPSGMQYNQLAKKIGHRQLGIGCDQLIIYKIEAEFVQMQIFNCDGSEAKACGNASRCLARLVHDNTHKQEIILKVGSREVRCRYHSPIDIAVKLGPVSFQSPWMPNQDFLLEANFVNMISPEEFICVDVGNPHAVIFTDLSKKEQRMVGKKLQDKSIFPDGVNVNFVHIDHGTIYLRVWERGAGFTYACGSGAVASFAASYKLGLCAQEAQVCFELGSLNMSVDSANEITMRGPAEYSFTGQILV